MYTLSLKVCDGSYGFYTLKQGSEINFFGGPDNLKKNVRGPKKI